MKHEPEIIFQNDDFIVINKPAGMLSIPDRIQSQSSLKDWLLQRYDEIFTVHRLDKETSGVIVFAKNEAAHRLLSGQFEHRETKKIYTGFVQGQLMQKRGIIDLPIIEHPAKKGLMITAKKGKPSLTEYEVIEELGSYSLLQFSIATGRTHQIRVHMKHLGYPLACDELYGNGEPVYLSSLKKKFRLSKHDEEERPILGRLALHAQKLMFTNAEGNPLEFEAALPKDMKALLQQLRKVVNGQ